MSCCAPGTEGAIEAASGGTLPSSEEMRLAARDLGEGLRQSDLSVPGVHCGACITTIEGVLSGLPSIESARVNLTARRVSVRWRDVEGFDPQTIPAAIARTGYAAHLFTAPIAADDALRNELIRAVAVSGFAAMNIMLLSVSVWSGAEASTRDLFHWISALIAGPVLIYAGRFFFRSAWGALKHGRTNMDVPISLAVTLSYFVSLWETIHHGEHAWFDATVTLLFFLLIGRTLDHVMRDRARSAITSLARLSPRGAMVVKDDGGREYRPVEEIAVGDRLSVAAGERLAVDARVIAGMSDVDRSLVSGESAPVTAKPGSMLEAGVMNLTGALVVEAVAVARDSFLAEVIGLMEAAEGGRARYRRIADRAASYYSPVVHLLALISFLGWGFADGDWKHAMLVAVAVLIITCPCALGLAVPVVQVVAAGRLFANGIMVKDGSAMERLAEIDAVVFDKTGTLTMGAPRLIGREAAGRPGTLKGDQAFAVAAALAAHSRHPLSAALAAAHVGPVPQFGAVAEIPGRGLEAVTPEGTWRLGNRAFACSGDEPADDGSSASEVVLSLDGAVIETFRFEDRLRPAARETVAWLRKDGIEVDILSGDRPAAVERVAAQLGVSRWRAGLAPRDKTEAVRESAAAGARVLMVGDGINDAPALSAAHVSMAPATAADIGRQAADLVFLRDGLDAVSFAVETSKRAGRLIRQNFALAIGYNVIAVPVAILGHATPLIAAVAMSTSSIIVVANSLRLRGRTPALRQDAAAPKPASGMARPA
ncbi:cation-translocating P-type ATPase [Rhizobium sp. TRM96647]|uniref:cation-translocating P-type ATPase n=1 Tax=unclassified Rhizobium TaxID=2613769 RepID=UPI0021E71F29|nr:MULTISPECIES: cation-translocating P-type ATPase [unclassified Rhizobium]MCV3737043.1 cation-translocating P-type ATPase [Rhizobium sp. TRM96647]MCV3756557.1 cation-translocating P-type ATPase [Rhizobium sp. TRM96650]